MIHQVVSIPSYRPASKFEARSAFPNSFDEKTPNPQGLHAPFKRVYGPSLDAQQHVEEWPFLQCLAFGPLDVTYFVGPGIYLIADLLGYGIWPEFHGSIGPSKAPLTIIKFCSII